MRKWSSEQCKICKEEECRFCYYLLEEDRVHMEDDMNDTEGR